MENLKKHLLAALKRRESLLREKETHGTDCFRLFCGESEGIPGLVVDLYGSVLVIQVYESECLLKQNEILEVAQFISAETQASSVYEKRFIVDRSSRTASEEYYSPKPLYGKEASEVVLCRENHVLYEIRPFAGFSTGLFLDQRENRKWISQQTRDKRVLNLFAYTCAFSVACASQGAFTMSVDLSKKYLDWGKRNFEANQLAPKEHAFVAADVFKFLKQATKKKMRFDWVIVDPPSFSRTKSGKAFSIKKDLEKLLMAVFPVLGENAILFFSSNFSGWDSSTLKKRSEATLQEIGNWEWLPEIEKPIDFRGTQVPLSQWAIQKY